ncbi:LOW QUALITY PROTEIN: uncharacterized protein LOC9310004 [Arabidopsis lyrata subsp. lyrata]|uniref:LOW QUALITY PROTEIN: uncharacterized protein LOC9310004 n=1 Tax=Arabidopsis lyrata subsp. lyrata TaxID=81972 RepID=UPI000A29BEC1|nr:LOW QUALITY PROTEIN: uncharacterized protein LOC9310004 [Arabidopsis lyrata subsp. lyrata]|eukprot:XP_002871867.2 LOW QUALITY PROTEIN: uncharacterized protein LOC9310004 [Arabidopsis lyrata subsp. lyrata]
MVQPFLFLCSVSKMEIFNSLMMLLIMGQFFIQLGVSVIPVSTIYSPDGDMIDCINRADQPAFNHPLLQNHIIQEYPTGMPQIERDVQKNWQIWHETGENCPAGTIPIRRDLDPKVPHKKQPKVHEVTNKATTGHKYAIAYMQNRQKVYGTRVTLNVWTPIVESSFDFSLAQIWLASGSYETADLNTVEAGWQVFRSRYNDSQPRLFTYWTADGYNNTGCYGLDRPGFVQTSSTIAIGAAIGCTSTFVGTPFDMTLQIWKDPFSGHWWLALGPNIVPIGYWPATIFTTLSDHATTVEWGGEVLYRNLSGANTVAQMGSGEYADKGYGKAAYFCNLKVAENNHTLLPVQDFSLRDDYPKYYTVKKSSNRNCGNHFYFGGPGPQRSGAVRGTVVCFLFGFCFLFYLSVCSF